MALEKKSLITLAKIVAKANPSASVAYHPVLRTARPQDTSAFADVLCCAPHGVAHSA